MDLTATVKDIMDHVAARRTGDALDAIANYFGARILKQLFATRQQDETVLKAIETLSEFPENN